MNRIIQVLILLGSANQLFAQGSGGSGAAGGGMASIIPMVLIMFVVFFFFIFRPEQKKQKEKQAMIKNLKKGDKVLTIGGIYGVVGNVKDDSVMVRISDNTTVKFAKSAVSNVITAKDDDKDNDEGTK